MPRKALNIDLLTMTPANKRRLQVWIGSPGVEGDYSISIEPRRVTRSQQANRYWWSCLCAPFAEFLSDGGYQKYSKDQAAYFIKGKILPPVQILDPRTGEVLDEIPADTHAMTTEEFYDFIERARAYLADEYGLIVPDPDPEWRSNRKAVRA